MAFLNRVQSPVTSPNTIRKPLIQLMSNRAEGQAQKGILALISTWLFQLAVLVLVSLLYLRAHDIDVIAWLRGDAGLHLSDYNFIDGNRSVGSLVEILYWTGVSATLRWMHLTSLLWRRNVLRPSQHLIEWLDDVVATTISATVIVYAFRSPHFGFGASQSISLETAEIGVFVVVGFLLGYYCQVPRIILNWVRNRTLDSYMQKHHRKGRKTKKRRADLGSRKHPDKKLNETE